MPTVSELMQVAKQHLDADRPLAAAEVLEGLARAAGDQSRTLVLFNLGAVYWERVGDGVSAKAALMRAYEACQTAGDVPRVRDEIEPNVCENLMILSGSYDEYDQWATRLRHRRPAADILRGQYPHVMAARERGAPWSGAMMGIASGYYNRSDASRDPGKYGPAASIYHLLLTHRRELRLRREDWIAAACEYGVLILRLTGDAFRRAPRNADTELAPIVAAAIPLVEECRAANSGDQNVAQLADRMKRVAADLSQAGTALREDEAVAETAPATASGQELRRCPHCGAAVTPAAVCSECRQPLGKAGKALLLGLAFSGAVYFGGRYLLPELPHWLVILAALLVGLFTNAFSVSSDVARLPVATSTKRVSVELTDITREPSRVVHCQHGHAMERFQDDGVLLARCPTCGIVKPYPNTEIDLPALMRVMAKYERFEM